MDTYINERPLELPAACAPMSAAWAILAADVPSLPRVHQVQSQSGGLLDAAPAGGYGTTGFTGEGIQVSTKWMDVRGVPPRGRPV